jgi:hypothetical protein
VIEPGQKYRWTTVNNRDDPRNGQVVTAVHKMSHDSFWRVEFADGGLLAAFENELTATG